MRLSVIAVGVSILLIVPAAAEDAPSSLVCRSNAKAWRDWSFIGGRWEGAGTSPFAVATVARPVEGFPLRDKVFSGLDTMNPVIRFITPPQKNVPEDASEFKGTVILRNPNEMFVSWTNDTNKVWLAVIDPRKKKATLAHLFEGATSVGGELETLDCR